MLRRLVTASLRLIDGLGKSSLAAAIDRDDSHTARIMKRVLQRDSNCVDVGCNQGQILQHIVHLAPDGRHWAFEALPKLAKKVAAKYRTVEVLAVALSDETGETEFRHVINDAGYSGMRERRYDRPDAQVEVITVPMRRLDDVLPESTPIRFVKIDVEGAELQVLRGGLRTLRAFRPYVVFEHGRGASEFYGTTPEAIHDLLSGECDLDISDLGGWLEGAPPLTRIGLRESYDRGAVWNYLAHPRSSP